MKTCQKLFFGVVLLCSSPLFGHGFAQETLVQIDTVILPIQELFHNFHKNTFWATSYDFTKQRNTTHVIKSVGKSRSNCYVKISFDDEPSHDILCTPNQEFYRAESEEWVPAVALCVGDELVGAQGVYSITALAFIKVPLKVYVLEIERTHNFFVGTHAILTHNMIIPWAISTTLAACTPAAWSLGQLGGLIGAIPCAGGIAVGALIGIIIKRLFVDDERARYKLHFNSKQLEKEFNNNILRADQKEDKNNDAQAPGKASEKTRPSGLTNDEARKKAKEWGYKEDKNPPFRAHGKPAFKKGQGWITPDRDGHNGGVWKEMDKYGNRKGTLDKNGVRIKI